MRSLRRGGSDSRFIINCIKKSGMRRYWWITMAVAAALTYVGMVYYLPWK